MASAPAPMSAAAGTGGTSGAVAGKNLKQVGDDVWKRSEKVNGELFALTYGALVAQMLRDYEDASQVNGALDKLGYSIGIRIVEELLARTQVRCGDLRETAEVVRMAFRIFLNVTAGLQLATERGEFVISLTEDGLGTEWVELPETALKGGLRYASLLCGVIRGALEMVHMQVECTILSDPLSSPTATSTDIRVKLVRMLEETMPPGE